MGVETKKKPGAQHSVEEMENAALGLGSVLFVFCLIRRTGLVPDFKSELYSFTL